MPRMRGAYLIAAFCNEFGIDPTKVKRIEILANMMDPVSVYVTETDSYYCIEPEHTQMDSFLQIGMKGQSYEIASAAEKESDKNT